MLTAARARARSLTMIALAVALQAAAARAQPEEPPEYREAIAAAISEYEAQSYREALEQFRRAHALFPNARTLRGLGLSSYELREYAASVSYLEQALASDVRPLEGATRDETVALLRRTRGYVGTVDLRVEPSSATVLLDGRELDAPADAPLRLSVGNHVLEFQAAGRAPVRRAVVVVGGQTQKLELSLPTLTEAGPRSASTLPSASDSESGRGRWVRKWWVWTLAGAAVAGGAVAAVFATRRETQVERPFGTDRTPDGAALSTRSR